MVGFISNIDLKDVKLIVVIYQDLLKYSNTWIPSFSLSLPYYHHDVIFKHKDIKYKRRESNNRW